MVEISGRRHPRWERSSEGEKKSRNPQTPTGDKKTPCRVGKRKTSSKGRGGKKQDPSSISAAISYERKQSAGKEDQGKKGARQKEKNRGKKRVSHKRVKGDNLLWGPILGKKAKGTPSKDNRGKSLDAVKKKKSQQTNLLKNSVAKINTRSAAHGSKIGL